MLKISKILLFFLLLVLSVSIISNLYFLYQSIENYRVVRVVDGDSFETKDDRRIRLLSLDAPEKGNCLYEESRERLKELVLGKRVKLTDIVTDDYGRILANVFIANWLYRLLHLGGVRSNTPEVFLTPWQTSEVFYPLFVNMTMLEEGLARFTYVSSPYYEELKETFRQAKEEKRGIYSPLCRNMEPVGDCNIKGNTRHGEKIYHLPHCKNYKQVIIDEAFGDRWFCSEEEAQKEGFRKASGC